MKTIGLILFSAMLTGCATQFSSPKPELPPIKEPDLSYLPADAAEEMVGILAMINLERGDQVEVAMGEAWIAYATVTDSDLIMEAIVLGEELEPLRAAGPKAASAVITRTAKNEVCEDNEMTALLDMLQPYVEDMHLHYRGEDGKMVFEIVIPTNHCLTVY